jgi:hypothetical protein
MKKFTIFHLPVWSFFSKSLYRDVCHEWKGTGIGYLFLLLLLCWAAPMISLHKGLAEFADANTQKFVDQVPVITISDGTLSIDEPQPYFLKVPDTDHNFVAIDTTGVITSLDGTNLMAVITATGAIIKKSEFETRSYNFAEIDSFTLKPEQIHFWLSLAKKYAAPIFYPFAVLGSFIGRIVQLLIYAAIGLLFASLCKSKRTYMELLRLSAVAVTPCIIVKTILMATQTSLPVAGLWYFLGAMGFLFFGVKVSAGSEAAPLNPSHQET